MGISQALLDLEVNSDLKTQLRDLHVTAAKETDVGGGKKSVIVFVPVPQLKDYRKIQTRLVRELEKKFSGRHFVFVAQRRILPKPTKKSRNALKQKRPRNRTLTSVHSAILDDVVFPAEIVGKRMRVKLNGSRTTKVLLDKSQQTQVEHKVGTYTAIYKTHRQRRRLRVPRSPSLNKRINKVAMKETCTSSVIFSTCTRVSFPRSGLVALSTFEFLGRRIVKKCV